MRTGVLLLLQLLCHHGSLDYGMIVYGSISSLLDDVINLTLDLNQGIIPAPDLRVQSALHGVNHPLAVPLDLLHLLILFCKFPVNLTLDLVEFQLDTKNLGLLMLESS
ncbi:hypothetical protein AALO_G00166380, partial [Alosa alosa]